MGDHIGSPLQRHSLSDVMDWFKTMSTNEYIKNVKENAWPPFNKRLWQRSFYDHVIRTEKAYIKYREYIQTNPLKWDDDVENKGGDAKRYYKKIIE